MRTFFVPFAISILLLAGCKTPEPQQSVVQPNVLVQVSVIDALLQGIYDGVYPVGRLLEHGDLGIGTFHGLDGEMVVLNDTVFQVLSSGKVNRPALDMTTPFASVVAFRPDTVFQLKDVTFDSLKNGADSFFRSKNLFNAIHLKGVFRTIRTRSVPAQSKPYKSLVEVTAHQPEFEFETVRGDVVGFYCPDFVKGVNVPGLHLHFLTADRTGGGHILKFELLEGTLEVDELFDFRLILPHTGDFLGGEFKTDRSLELKQAENE